MNCNFTAQKHQMQFACKHSENESPEATRFNKSLQELKDLRSQLHYAADYCESTFSNAKEKKMVVNSTKEYICRAIVTVVDHVGCVSANLNHSISDTNEFSEAEHKIDTLKQKLLSWEQYAHKVALTRVRWHPNLPKVRNLHAFVEPAAIISDDKSTKDVTMVPNSAACANIISKHGFEAEDLPLFLHTNTSSTPKTKPYFSRTSSTKTIDKDDGSNSASVLAPVRDGVSVLSGGPNPTFHFQQNTQKRGRYNLFRKSLHNNDILSIIRRVKRET